MAGGSPSLCRGHLSWKLGGDLHPGEAGSSKLADGKGVSWHLLKEERSSINTFGKLPANVSRPPEPSTAFGSVVTLKTRRAFNWPRTVSSGISHLLSDCSPVSGAIIVTKASEGMVAFTATRCVFLGQGRYAAELRHHGAAG